MHPYFVLTAGMAEPESVSERLFYGLRMLAFGMAVVFSVLAIIWLVLVLFRLVFTAIEKKRANGGSTAQQSEPSGAADTASSIKSAASSDDGAVLVFAPLKPADGRQQPAGGPGERLGEQQGQHRRVGDPQNGTFRRRRGKENSMVHKTASLFIVFL